MQAPKIIRVKRFAIVHVILEILSIVFGVLSLLYLGLVFGIISIVGSSLVTCQCCDMKTCAKAYLGTAITAVVGSAIEPFVYGLYVFYLIYQEYLPYIFVIAGFSWSIIMLAIRIVGASFASDAVNVITSFRSGHHTLLLRILGTCIRQYKRDFRSQRMLFVFGLESQSNA